METTDATFMDLRTDFGFKYLFGTPKHAHVLMRFLNALFEGKMVVTEVSFHDKEMLPPDPQGKRTIYDIYCTTSEGHHFIIEMQRADTPDFGHRVIFYTSAAIVAQGRRGMTYAINPVYSIILTDFDLKWLSRRLIHEVLFMERSSGEVYTEDVKMMFISLKQVGKEWSECSTELEKLLYLIKNIHTMDKNNELYRSGDYSDVFEAAEIVHLANEERVEYSKSYWKMKDDEAALEYAKQQAIAEGRAEGMEKGRAEGMEKGMEKGIEKGMKKGMEKGILQTALKLLKAGVSKDLICKTTGLTPEQLSLG